MFVTALLSGRACCHPARQIASELASNAVAHTASGQPDGWFVVHVLLFPDRVRVCVFDLGHPHNTPTLKNSAPDQETGRGLSLVAALAAQWGVQGDAAGRTVWAELPDRRK